MAAACDFYLEGRIRANLGSYMNGMGSDDMKRNCHTFKCDSF